MTADAMHCMRGMVLMPKRKREGYSWLHIHVSKPLHDAVAKMADDQDRSMSGMAARLLKEAMLAHGVDVESEGSQQEGERDGDER